MPHLADNDVDDLVIAALEQLPEGEFYQVAQDLNEYEVMGNLLQKDKLLIDSGRGFKRTLMTKVPDVFRQVGLHEKDVVDIIDLLTQINVPWTHSDAYWAWDVREVMEASGEELVVDIVQPRRLGSFLSTAGGFEERYFTAPALADVKEPFGMPFWVTPSSTTGFNGLAATGHTTKGGINPDNESKWRNYTFEYTNIDQADLIKKMRRMKHFTRWISPTSVPQLRGIKGEKYRIYCQYDPTLTDLEDLMKDQNDNLGNDIAAMDGQTVFRGHPIIAPYQMDEFETNSEMAEKMGCERPIYFINRASFFVIVLKANYLRESAPRVAPEQHNDRVQWQDTSYNFVCIDPRRNGVGQHSSTA